jgi:predicted ester cyclase
MDKRRFLAYNQNYMKAFPDVHFDITLTVSEGAFVIMHWNASGTQTASLATPSGGIIVATGVKVYAPGSFTFRLQEGKISHAWVFWDMATMLAQLGQLPPL